MRNNRHIEVTITNLPKSKNQLTAYAAVFVSVLALVTSAYSAYTTRQNNRLAVVPHINISELYEVSEVQNYLGWHIGNDGIGPASIAEFEVRSGDRVVVHRGSNGEVVGSRSDLVNLVGSGVLAELNPTTWIPEEGFVLGVKERRPLFAFTVGSIVEKFGDRDKERAYEVIGSIREKLGQLEISVTYCSFYEECKTAVGSAR